jgi:lysophospholipase L1-like esterase
MNNRILIFGDSITWGAWDKEGGWATRLKKYTDQQAMEGLENYDAVYPLGISGNNTVDLLKRFPIELENRLSDEWNTIVVLAIGINDSKFNFVSQENQVPINKFNQNLREIVKIAKQYTQEIVVVGLTPVDDSLLYPMPWNPNYGYNNANVKKYNTALTKFARENNLPFIALYKLLAAYESDEALHDGLHPNTKGHRLIFNKIVDELKKMEVLQ